MYLSGDSLQTIASRLQVPSAVLVYLSGDSLHTIAVSFYATSLL